MAFVRAASPKYFAPAVLNILGGDGQLIASKFDCEFKRLKRSDLVALRRDVDLWSAHAMADLQKQAQALAVATEEGNEPTRAGGNTVIDMVSRKVLERVLTGWRGVQAPDNTDLPFSLEALDETEEEFPGFINACSQAFWDSCEPKAAAHLAAKN